MPELLNSEEVVSRVVAALLKGEHYHQAGQLYEAVNRVDKALEAYRRGHAYAKAVELARYVSPKGQYRLYNSSKVSMCSWFAFLYFIYLYIWICNYL